MLTLYTLLASPRYHSDPSGVMVTPSVAMAQPVGYQSATLTVTGVKSVAMARVREKDRPPASWGMGMVMVSPRFAGSLLLIMSVVPLGEGAVPPAKALS